MVSTAVEGGVVVRKYCGAKLFVRYDDVSVTRI